MLDVNKKLALRLRELRGEKTLYQVQQDTRISRSLLRRYEIGERTPEDEMLSRLANYYGVSYEELKMLYFEDIYPLASKVREVLFQWVKQEETEKKDRK